MAKKTIFIEFKYDGKPWIEYDRTQVDKWAEVQYNRMLIAHPDAQHRKVKR